MRKYSAVLTGLILIQTCKLSFSFISHSLCIQLTETVGQLVLASSPTRKHLTWLSGAIYRQRSHQGGQQSAKINLLSINHF
uniref:Secreted protein n=1 Tax=Xiphophorus couchianus TaxID=32473 RepID=A0A3B5L1T7_9TELE